MIVLSVKYDKEPKPSSYLPASGFEPKPKGPVEKRKVKEEVRSPLYHPTEVRRPQVRVPDTLAVEEMQRGEILHAVLARMQFVDGKTETVVRSHVETVSKLEHDRFDSAEMVRTLVGFFEGTEIGAYFEPREGRTVLTEQEFVRADGSLVRMDRVVVDPGSVLVIDYKTGEEQSEHAEQVREYMETLKEAYPGRKVRGILAYVDRKRLKEVV